MTRLRIAALILTVALAAACGGGAADRSQGLPGGSEPAAEEEPAFTDSVNQMEVTLYFLRPDGEALAPEIHRIFRTATVLDRARQTVQALLDGPEGDLVASVPPGTQLMEIFITGEGTAYVDLGSEFDSGLGAGTSDAVYAVYAIVNTLTWNFPEVERVKILVDGDEAGVLGGHLDLSYPILPEMGLVDLSLFDSRAGARAEPAGETARKASPPLP